LVHMRSPREDFEAAARHLTPVHGSSAPSPDDMPTVPIPARKAAKQDPATALRTE